MTFSTEGQLFASIADMKLIENATTEEDQCADGCVLGDGSGPARRRGYVGGDTNTDAYIRMANRTIYQLICVIHCQQPVRDAAPRLPPAPAAASLKGATRCSGRT